MCWLAAAYNLRRICRRVKYLQTLELMLIRRHLHQAHSLQMAKHIDVRSCQRQDFRRRQRRRVGLCFMFLIVGKAGRPVVALARELEIEFNFALFLFERAYPVDNRQPGSGLTRRDLDALDQGRRCPNSETIHLPGVRQFPTRRQIIKLRRGFDTAEVCSNQFLRAGDYLQTGLVIHADGNIQSEGLEVVMPHGNSCGQSFMPSLEISSGSYQRDSFRNQNSARFEESLSRINHD